MVKLLVKNKKTGDYKEIEFKNAELAILYRDYHIAFGYFGKEASWVLEQELQEEHKPFIIKEKTEIINGDICKSYLVSSFIEINITNSDKKDLVYIWDSFRIKRNSYLLSTDWTQVSDSALNVEERKEYRAYRSYLRNLPSLHNDGSILTAKVYSFEEWKKGNR